MISKSACYGKSQENLKEYARNRENSKAKSKKYYKNNTERLQGQGIFTEIFKKKKRHAKRTCKK